MTVKKALTGLYRLVVLVLMAPIQIVRGFWDILVDGGLEKFIPDWLKRLGAAGLAAFNPSSDPKEGVLGSVVLIAFSIATTWWTGLATVVITLPLILLFLYWAFRMSDVGDSIASKVSPSVDLSNYRRRRGGQ